MRPSLTMAIEALGTLVEAKTWLTAVSILAFASSVSSARRVSENKARKRSDLRMPAPIVRGEAGVYTTPGCLHAESLLAWLWPGRRHKRFRRCWRRAAIARSAIALLAWAAFPWITLCPGR